MIKFLIGWLVFSSLITTPCLIADESIGILSPKKLYRRTKMNWFGCYLVSIFVGVIIPLYGVVSLLYFTTHVGRKDK